MTAPRIVLLGPPTAGKSSLSFKLAQELSVPQINLGWMLRNLPHTRSAISDGRPLPDADVLAVVASAIVAAPGYVLDGYPRSRAQLAQFCDLPCSADARFVLLDLSLEQAAQRLARRRVCSACKRADYGEDGGDGERRCASCGGSLDARSDAGRDADREKLRSYVDREQPMLAAMRRLQRVTITGDFDRDYLALRAACA